MKVTGMNIKTQKIRYIFTASWNFNFVSNFVSIWYISTTNNTYLDNTTYFDTISTVHCPRIIYGFPSSLRPVPRYPEVLEHSS